MRSVMIGLLVLCTVLALGLTGCGGDNERSSFEAPIHLEMDTDNLQPRMGLSGFVFGTFLLLNAYLIIIASCIVLILKDSSVQKITDTLKMIIPMFNPSSAEKGSTFLNLFGTLSSSDIRIKVGSVGLIIGVLLAYIGSWIAM